MPLTERQQMAFLLEMTAKEFKEETDKKNESKKLDEEADSKKSSSSSKSELSKINKRNKRGETQLHLAAIKGDIDTVKSLIKKGADVNVTDYAGWAPLHEGCSRGHYKIVKILLKAGADANAKGLEDDTPLHDASSNDHVKIVHILLKYRADPMKRNDDLETPLDLAASSEISNVLEQYCSLTDVEKESYGVNADFLSDSSEDEDFGEKDEQKIAEQTSDSESKPGSWLSNEFDPNSIEKNIDISDEKKDPHSQSHIVPDENIVADESVEDDEEINFTPRKKKRRSNSFSKRIASDDDEEIIGFIQNKVSRETNVTEASDKVAFHHGKDYVSPSFGSQESISLKEGASRREQEDQDSECSDSRRRQRKSSEIDRRKGKSMRGRELDEANISDYDEDAKTGLFKNKGVPKIRKDVDGKKSKQIDEQRYHDYNDEMPRKRKKRNKLLNYALFQEDENKANNDVEGKKVEGSGHGEYNDTEKGGIVDVIKARKEKKASGKVDLFTVEGLRKKQAKNRDHAKDRKTFSDSESDRLGTAASRGSSRRENRAGKDRFLKKRDKTLKVLPSKGHSDCEREKQFYKQRSSTLLAKSRERSEDKRKRSETGDEDAYKSRKKPKTEKHSSLKYSSLADGDLDSKNDQSRVVGSSRKYGNSKVVESDEENADSSTASESRDVLVTSSDSESPDDNIRLIDLVNSKSLTENIEKNKQQNVEIKVKRSPVSEECTSQLTSAFNDNPYISDISDAENVEEDDNQKERMTSDMFRVNIFNQALNQASDNSLTADSSLITGQQSDSSLSDYDNRISSNPAGPVASVSMKTDDQSVKQELKDARSDDDKSPCERPHQETNLKGGVSSESQSRSEVDKTSASDRIRPIESIVVSDEIKTPLEDRDMEYDNSLFPSQTATVIENSEIISEKCNNITKTEIEKSEKDSSENDDTIDRSKSPIFVSAVQSVSPFEPESCITKACFETDADSFTPVSSCESDENVLDEESCVAPMPASSDNEEKIFSSSSLEGDRQRTTSAGTKEDSDTQTSGNSFVPTVPLVKEDLSHGYKIHAASLEKDDLSHGSKIPAASLEKDDLSHGSEIRAASLEKEDLSCRSKIPAASFKKDDLSCDSRIPAPSFKKDDLSCDSRIPAASLEEEDLSCRSKIPAASLKKDDLSCDSRIPATSLEEEDLSCGSKIPAASFKKDDLSCDSRIPATSLEKEDLSHGSKIRAASLKKEDLSHGFKIPTAPFDKEDVSRGSKIPATYLKKEDVSRGSKIPAASLEKEDLSRGSKITAAPLKKEDLSCGSEIPTASFDKEDLSHGSEISAASLKKEDLSRGSKIPTASSDKEDLSHGSKITAASLKKEDLSRGSKIPTASFDKEDLSHGSKIPTSSFIPTALFDKEDVSRGSKIPATSLKKEDLSRGSKIPTASFDKEDLSHGSKIPTASFIPTALFDKEDVSRGSKIPATSLKKEDLSRGSKIPSASSDKEDVSRGSKIRAALLENDPQPRLPAPSKTTETLLAEEVFYRDSSTISKSHNASLVNDDLSCSYGIVSETATTLLANEDFSTVNTENVPTEITKTTLAKDDLSFHQESPSVSNSFKTSANTDEVCCDKAVALVDLLCKPIPTLKQEEISDSASVLEKPLEEVNKTLNALSESRCDDDKRNNSSGEEITQTHFGASKDLFEIENEKTNEMLQLKPTSKIATNLVQNLPEIHEKTFESPVISNNKPDVLSSTEIVHTNALFDQKTESSDDKESQSSLEHFHQVTDEGDAFQTCPIDDSAMQTRPDSSKILPSELNMEVIDDAAVAVEDPSKGFDARSCDAAADLYDDLKLANDATSMDSPKRCKETDIDMKLDSMTPGIDFDKTDDKNVNNAIKMKDTEIETRNAVPNADIALDIMQTSSELAAEKQLEQDFPVATETEENISLTKNKQPAVQQPLDVQESLSSSRFIHEEKLIDKDVGGIEHLGPFHGTKFEESDVELQELSHPEDALKRLLTEGVHARSPGQHVALQSSKNDEAELTVLSGDVNENFDHLKRTYFTELSEEDKHIVNMSMEIAENLNSNACAHLDDVVVNEAKNENPSLLKEKSGNVEENACEKKVEPICEFKHSEKIDSEVKTLPDDIEKPRNDLLLLESADAIETELTDERKDIQPSKPILKPDAFGQGASKTTQKDLHSEQNVSFPGPYNSNSSRSPTSKTTRTVDIEPRGIPRVVADIDLHPIAPCQPVSSEQPKYSDGTVTPINNDNIETDATGKTNEKTIPNSESAVNNNDDALLNEIPEKKKTDRPTRTSSPSYPSTWREKLFRNHVVLHPKIPAFYHSFSLFTGKYHLEDGEETSKDDDAVEEVEEMKEEHAVELEKLHLCMEQELVRIESKVQLVSSNNNPISACSTVMHQKLEQYAKLGLNPRCNSNPNSDIPDVVDLRKSWIQEVLDKYIQLEQKIISRQKKELGCLEQQVSFNKLHAIGRKEGLRRKYLNGR